MDASSNRPSVDLWGGVECTIARVGDRYTDQLGTTGHHARASDLELFAGLGLKALRYPVLWERVAPERADLCDWTWTDERLARLRELGIRPILTLVHHGSGPRYTSLADPRFAARLGDFAARVAARYPWAEDYTPVNEPLTTARFSGLYGHWYPHGRDARLVLRLLVNELAGTRLAMAAIRRVNPAARLIQTDDLGCTWSTPRLQYQADFENARRWLSWDLLSGRVGADHPLYDYLLAHGISGDELECWLAAPCPPDVVGINHYLTSERFLDHRVHRYPTCPPGGNGRHRYADVEAQRVVAGGCAGPEGLLREAWQRYRLPLAVTEAHNGCTREEQMRWFAHVWQSALRLKESGVDIRAVTAWSLMGATDWNSMLTRADGFYEPGVFDIRAPEPRPTAMVQLLRDLAQNGHCDHPVLDSPGWWARRDRLHYPPVRCKRPGPLAAACATTGKRRSLIIVGAHGTLGQALARACARRAIAYRLLGRDTFDIADDAAVARVLADVRPWAVINAAGCVDVDRAESDVARCWRDNCTGPERLADACAARGIALVTFSSDLVFDGAKPGPYLEIDAVAPLNVYGQSKASAERSVLVRHPETLVVRTSAFFGPSDRFNFATQTLARLRAGERVAAVDGVAVSPTYVPDLVDHTLDLLIDGETGIWHLANRGRISWYEFARELAGASGLDDRLIHAVAPAQAGWIAARPTNSTLASNRGSIMPGFESAVGRFLDAARRFHELGEPAPLLRAP